MGRGKCKFRQSDVTRAAKAARKAGAEGIEIDPNTGKFRIILGGAATATANVEDDKRNPWDEVFTNAANKKRAS